MFRRLTGGSGLAEFLIDEIASIIFHGVDQFNGSVVEAVAILVERGSFEGRSWRSAGAVILFDGRDISDLAHFTHDLGWRMDGEEVRFGRILMVCLLKL